MSTIAMAKKNGYVAISCDSGSTYKSVPNQSYVSNESNIIKISNTFYLAINGSSHCRMAIEDYFLSSAKEDDFNNIPTIFHNWVEFYEVLERKYRLKQENMELTDVVIANSHGIFGIAFRNVREYSQFYSFGDGRYFALGAMYVGYQDPNKTAEDVARIGVETACAFFTGIDPIYSHSIKLIDVDKTK